MGNSSKDDSGSDGDAPSGDAPLPDSNHFTEGERVLAYHGPRIYEAKVQKAELRKKEWKYFVHYLRIANSWDEWVGADRLMKHTEENILKQQALDKKQNIDKSSRLGRGHTKPKNSSENSKNLLFLFYDIYRKVFTADGLFCQKGNASIDKLGKIQIPSTLKKQLVDDWDFVTQQEKLVKLPRSPTVDDILAKYLEYKSKKEGVMTDSTGEVLKGLRCYFDKALPVMLLYKNERQQYQNAVKEDVSPSTIYGAEHLLRLFVKLPELLSYVNIEEETLTPLQQKLLDFLKFLQKNQSTFFLSAYDSSKVSESKGKGKDE
ncbi:Protein MRG1 [Linum perenne]